jgi:hypothetical protein
MATNVVIVRPHDYVRATPDGTLDQAASERLLSEVAAATRGLPECDVVLDTRGAQVTMTIGDLWHLAQYLVRLPEMWNRKIAVLPPTDDLGRATFFALAAGNRGGWVRAFASFEEAIDWFVAGRTELPR